MSSMVALLAEGVDRNSCSSSRTRRRSVALLAEGVDRNYIASELVVDDERSPSSRRAWIEMCQPLPLATQEAVALLAEGVDRNVDNLEAVQQAIVALLAEGVDRNLSIWAAIACLSTSPSSRRAWIEIQSCRCLSLHPRRRPPRGGRG